MSKGNYRFYCYRRRTTIECEENTFSVYLHAGAFAIALHVGVRNRTSLFYNVFAETKETKQSKQK
jgi:hypothetical protein